MSYRSVILSDLPIAYYPLDDFTSSSSMGYTDLIAQNDDYQDILTNYETYQDITGTKPLTYAELLLTYGSYAEVASAYASYSNLGGDIAYDNSECQNNGKYIGRPVSSILPIVKGNSTAAKITDSVYIEYTIDKDYSGQTGISKFATSDSYDNDFTIEFWFYPQITGNFNTPLFADKTPDHEVGVFYYKGNIVFQVDQNKVEYTLPFINKAFHVVATYTQNLISIYIDGVWEAEKQISGNSFTRDIVNFKSGPTGISQNFLINSVAIYRYALSKNQILNHYNNGKSINPSQIIETVNGEWFNIYDDNTYPVYQYGWPSNNAWQLFLNNDLVYNQEKEYIVVKATDTQTPKTIILEDRIILPSDEMDSSKIEWDGDNGITVETSDDGISYTQCINGSEIPQYSYGNFSLSRQLFIRVTINTVDASRFNPRFNYLITKFYNNVRKYAVNGPSYIESNNSFTMGRVSSNILLRDSRNGIRVNDGSSFNINTFDDIKSIELFYTPYNLDQAGALVFAGTTLLSWDSSGNLARANIDQIYVNNYNKTSATNIKDILVENDINYLVITFTQPITGQITINGSSLGGGSSGLYQNIALYKTVFSQNDVLTNFNLYRYGDVYTILDLANSSATLTEYDVNTYDIEWQTLTNQ